MLGVINQNIEFWICSWLMSALIFLVIHLFFNNFLIICPFSLYFDWNMKPSKCNFFANKIFCKLASNFCSLPGTVSHSHNLGGQHPIIILYDVITEQRDDQNQNCIMFQMVCHIELYIGTLLPCFKLKHYLLFCICSLYNCAQIFVTACFWDFVN